MTNLNDLFARDMAFRDIVIETAARAIGSTSKEFAEEWLMVGGDNARSAKRAAAVERLNSVEQATDENLLDAILGAPNGMTLYGAEKLVALKALLTDDNGAWRINDGVTNLEWLWENDKDGLDCFEVCDSRFGEDCNSVHCCEGWSVCNEYDKVCGSMTKIEWLMAPHMDAQRDINRTCPNDNETASNSVDSREMLEDDANMLADVFTSTYSNHSELFGKIIELLNRQAAITRKTEQAAWIQQANGLIHEANVERDELRDAINVLQNKQPYCYDPDKPLDTIKTIGRYIDELQAKVDELAELNSYAWQEGFEKGCESRDDAIADWRAETDELREELAKRDKGIERLKRQRDTARAKIDELHVECDTCCYKTDYIEMDFYDVDRLEAERDALAADLRDCERQRERLRQALGCAIDHAHEIVSLVNLDGEVIG